MSENQATLQALEERSHSTVPRRELLQKAASVALLLGVKPLTDPAKKKYPYPAPAFRIGDKIVSPWFEEIKDEEIEEIEDEVGEVMGVCWHPQKKRWEYLINWTGGDAADWMYPVFDETLMPGDGFRSASHA
ncbi:MULTISPECIES: hypothetical protein [unclassified Microcoleus]|uniref:hypothetical protein n=1 Tax=unclassified Microcoleus TaxID=2642155 RepID=UPI002FD0BFA9